MQIKLDSSESCSGAGTFLNENLSDVVPFLGRLEEVYRVALKNLEDNGRVVTVDHVSFLRDKNDVMDLFNILEDNELYVGKLTVEDLDGLFERVGDHHLGFINALKIMVKGNPSSMLVKQPDEGFICVPYSNDWSSGMVFRSFTVELDGLNSTFVIGWPEFDKDTKVVIGIGEGLTFSTATRLKEILNGSSCNRKMSLFS